MPADSTDLELVISCSSVSCLISKEPLELLRLQSNEPIASESASQQKSRARAGHNNFFSHLRIGNITQKLYHCKLWDSVSEQRQS